jgi:hypothetical protein
MAVVLVWVPVLALKNATLSFDYVSTYIFQVRINARAYQE